MSKHNPSITLVEQPGRHHQVCITIDADLTDSGFALDAGPGLPTQLRFTRKLWETIRRIELRTELPRHPRCPHRHRFHSDMMHHDVQCLRGDGHEGECVFS